MRKEEIKTIMIVHNDNHFVRVWDWIGKILLETMINTNVCNEEMLEDSETIEDFVFSLLPVAIEFAQYKACRYEDYVRYEDISKEEVKRLSDYFKKVKFVYNFDKETNDNWIFGGCETLIIDLEKIESYIQNNLVIQKLILIFVLSN